MSCGAIGLLAASRTKTFEAISGLINLILLPMWIASGVFFSASRFPEVVQPFVQALPLTALVDALRAVVLEGAPLTRYPGRVGDSRGLGRRAVCDRPQGLPVEIRTGLQASGFGLQA